MIQIRLYQTKANNSRVNYIYTAPTEEQDKSDLSWCDRQIEKAIANMKKASTMNEYYDAQQTYNYYCGLRPKFL